MVSIKPAFQSAKPDDPEALADGQITPSRWNADLATLMATARILGRTTAGNGPIEELDAATARTLLGIILGAGAGNVPVLDGSGKLATSVLPALALTDTFEVASQAAMLALSAQQGDIAIRTDLNKTFVLSSNSPSTLADWKELRTPTDVVLAVAGLTGTITAAALKTALAMTAADITDLSANGRSLIKAADYAAMKTLLGLVIGTNVQAQNAKLSDIATATFTAGDSPVWNGTNFVPQAAGGGSVIKSITYYDVASTSLTTGSGGEAKYFNVTVAGTDASKMVADFFGAGTSSTGAYLAAAYSAGGSSEMTGVVSAKVVSSTSVRIASPNSYVNQMAGRLRVVEYK